MAEDSKAVFIDRNNTINRDIRYCSWPKDFELLLTVGVGIRLLNHAAFKVVVITNQYGKDRAYFTEEILQRVHQKMTDELATHGAYIDAICNCPHHPEEGRECRKPKPKLTHRAMKDSHLDPLRSYIIGDNELMDYDTFPDYIGPDFKSGARRIIQ